MVNSYIYAINWATDIHTQGHQYKLNCNQLQIGEVIGFLGIIHIPRIFWNFILFISKIKSKL